MKAVPWDGDRRLGLHIRVLSCLEAYTSSYEREYILEGEDVG